MDRKVRKGKLLNNKKGGELTMAANAISFQKVLNLSVIIRQRLKKEANGSDQLEKLKATNLKLAQLIVDIDWALTNWGHQVVRTTNY